MRRGSVLFVSHFWLAPKRARRSEMAHFSCPIIFGPVEPIDSNEHFRQQHPSNTRVATTCDSKKTTTSLIHHVTMFSVGSRKSRAGAKKAESPSSFGINFYNDTPTVELDLDTFEIYALKRLKVRFTDEEERILALILYEFGIDFVCMPHVDCDIPASTLFRSFANWNNCAPSN